MQRRIEPEPTIAEQDAARAEELARKGVVITRAWRRDPSWQGWSYEPGIVFDEPIDVLELLNDDDDEASVQQPDGS